MVLPLFLLHLRAKIWRDFSSYLIYYIARITIIFYEIIYFLQI